VATANVHYASREDFPLHDLFTCVRTHTTVSTVHSERPLNSENYLKSAAEIKALLAAYPQAVTESARLAESLSPSLPTGKLLFLAFLLRREKQLCPCYSGLLFRVPLSVTVA